LKALPDIIAQAVKPLEKIEGIKILQGYGTGNQMSNGEGNQSQGGIAEQVTTAALNYRANAPVVDAMLRELGLVNSESGNLNDLLTGNNALTSEAINVIQAAKTGFGVDEVIPGVNPAQ
ncbi:MAG: flotillin, partial [Shewanella sp.]